MELVVVDIRGDKVRLGIQAPSEFSVMRDDAKKRQPAERRRAFDREVRHGNEDEAAA